MSLDVLALIDLDRSSDDRGQRWLKIGSATRLAKTTALAVCSFRGGMIRRLPLAMDLGDSIVNAQIAIQNRSRSLDFVSGHFQTFKGLVCDDVMMLLVGSATHS